MKSERASCPFEKCAGSFNCNTGAAYHHFLKHFASGACKHSGVEHECNGNVCVRAKAAEFIQVWKEAKAGKEAHTHITFVRIMYVRILTHHYQKDQRGAQVMRDPTATEPTHPPQAPATVAPTPDTLPLSATSLPPSGTVRSTTSAEAAAQKDPKPEAGQGEPPPPPTDAEVATTAEAAAEKAAAKKAAEEVAAEKAAAVTLHNTT